jgi:hypothetical protein
MMMMPAVFAITATILYENRDYSRRRVRRSLEIELAAAHEVVALRVGANEAALSIHKLRAAHGAELPPGVSLFRRPLGFGQDGFCFRHRTQAISLFVMEFTAVDKFFCKRGGRIADGLRP